MITTWIAHHWLEVFGALAGILFVILEIRQNIWLWPIGIVTSAVYIIVFFSSKFYADMSLQFYYVAVSIYGWYIWSYGKKRGNEVVTEVTTAESSSLAVTGTPRKIIPALIIAWLLLHLSIYIILEFFTDSPVAFWDSLTTALSIVATWMLARKYIEHWFIWIFVNIVSMILYIYKGLYPTVILFAVYTIMSFIGYREWRRDMITTS
jgi:nicotinamide mononucleotide transporter